MSSTTTTTTTTTSSSNSSSATAPRTEIVSDRNMFALTANIGDKTYTGALLVSLPAVASKAGKDLTGKFDALSREQLLVAIDPTKRASHGAQVLDAALLKAFAENKVRVALGLTNGLVYDLGGALSTDDTPFSEASYKSTQLSHAAPHFFGENGDKDRMFTSTSRWLGTLRETLWVDANTEKVGAATLASLRGKCGGAALLAAGIKRNSKANVNLYVMVMAFKEDGAPHKLVPVKRFNERTKGAVKMLNVEALGASSKKGRKSGTKRKAAPAAASALASAALPAPLPEPLPIVNADVSASLLMLPPVPSASAPAAEPVVDNEDVVPASFFDDSDITDDDFAEVMAAKKRKTTDNNSGGWLSPQCPPPLYNWSQIVKKNDIETQLDPESRGEANARDLLTQLTAGLPFYLPPAQKQPTTPPLLCMPRNNTTSCVQVTVDVSPLPQMVRAVCSEPVAFGANEWVQTLKTEQPELFDAEAPRYHIKMTNVPESVRASILQGGGDDDRQFAHFAIAAIIRHVEESHDVYLNSVGSCRTPDGCGLPSSASDLQTAAYMHAMKDCGTTDDECDAMVRRRASDAASFSMSCGVDLGLPGNIFDPVGSMIFG